MSAPRTVRDEEVRRLLDIVVASMDFQSGFLDHEEADFLRDIAEQLGMDPITVTVWPEQYAHDFKGVQAMVRTVPRPEWEERCDWCNRDEQAPVHHGVSAERPTTDLPKPMTMWGQAMSARARLHTLIERAGSEIGLDEVADACRAKLEAKP